MQLYTVGHSNQTVDELIDLLTRNNVQVLVDVRSAPYSQFATQFNYESIKSSFSTSTIEYLYLGKELGGRPEKEEFYDQDGHVLYDRVSQSPLFRLGIDKLTALLREKTVAIMCSEENPATCHRRLLISRVMQENGCVPLHLRADGRVQTEADVERENSHEKDFDQESLFSMEGRPNEWKSTRSVLPKKAPNNSSKR